MHVLWKAAHAKVWNVMVDGSGWLSGFFHAVCTTLMTQQALSFLLGSRSHYKHTRVKKHITLLGILGWFVVVNKDLWLPYNFRGTMVCSRRGCTCLQINIQCYDHNNRQYVKVKERSLTIKLPTTQGVTVYYSSCQLKLADLDNIIWPWRHRAENWSRLQHL